MSKILNDDEVTDDYHTHCPECGAHFSYFIFDMHTEYCGYLFYYINSYVYCPKCNNKVYV